MSQHPTPNPPTPSPHPTKPSFQALRPGATLWKVADARGVVRRDEVLDRPWKMEGLNTLRPSCPDRSHPPVWHQSPD
ncbi:hypothetical protein INR49_012065 [Caranx melampygus]|nr:hypothetical protein INR49_012065 [Caranx melampygus]